MALERKKFSLMSCSFVWKSERKGKKLQFQRGKGKGKLQRSCGGGPQGRRAGKIWAGCRGKEEEEEEEKEKEEKKKSCFFVLTRHFFCFFPNFPNGKTGFSLKSHCCLFSPFSLTSLSKKFPKFEDFNGFLHLRHHFTFRRLSWSFFSWMLLSFWLFDFPFHDAVSLQKNLLQQDLSWPLSLENLPSSPRNFPVSGASVDI